MSSARISTSLPFLLHLFIAIPFVEYPEYLPATHCNHMYLPIHSLNRVAHSLAGGVKPAIPSNSFNSKLGASPFLHRNSIAAIDHFVGDEKKYLLRTYLPRNPSIKIETTRTAPTPLPRPNSETDYIGLDGVSHKDTHYHLHCTTRFMV